MTTPPPRPLAGEADAGDASPPAGCPASPSAPVASPQTALEFGGALSSPAASADAAALSGGLADLSLDRDGARRASTASPAHRGRERGAGGADGGEAAPAPAPARALSAGAASSRSPRVRVRVPRRAPGEVPGFPETRPRPAFRNVLVPIQPTAYASDLVADPLARVAELAGRPLGGGVPRGGGLARGRGRARRRRSAGAHRDDDEDDDAFWSSSSEDASDEDDGARRGQAAQARPPVDQGLRDDDSFALLLTLGGAK